MAVVAERERRAAGAAQRDERGQRRAPRRSRSGPCGGLHGARRSGDLAGLAEDHVARRRRPSAGPSGRGRSGRRARRPGRRLRRGPCAASAEAGIAPRAAQASASAALLRLSPDIEDQPRAAARERRRVARDVGGLDVEHVAARRQRRGQQVGERALLLRPRRTWRCRSGRERSARARRRMRSSGPGSCAAARG